METFHLGSLEKHEVYDGEGIGLLLAMRIIRRITITRVNGRRQVNIYIDNQAAAKALTLRRPATSHYIWDAIHEEYARAKRKHAKLHISIRWIPAHKEVHGNERADQEAKLAAGGQNAVVDKSYPKILRHAIPQNRASLRKTHSAKLQRKADHMWRQSPHYRRMQVREDSTTARRYQKLTEGLSRAHSSILVQLSTGHCPLNGHLHRMKQIDSPLCLHCGEHESVIHFLCHCPAFRRQRQTFIRAVGYRNFTLQKILTTRNYLPALMAFVAATNRFSTVFRHIPELSFPEKQTR